jgi:hypothetical protein
MTGTAQFMQRDVDMTGAGVRTADVKEQMGRNA